MSVDINILYYLMVNEFFVKISKYLKRGEGREKGSD